MTKRFKTCFGLACLAFTVLGITVLTHDGQDPLEPNPLFADPLDGVVPVVTLAANPDEVKAIEDAIERAKVEEEIGAIEVSNWNPAGWRFDGGCIAFVCSSGVELWRQPCKTYDYGEIPLGQCPVCGAAVARHRVFPGWTSHEYVHDYDCSLWRGDVHYLRQPTNDTNGYSCSEGHSWAVRGKRIECPFGCRDKADWAKRGEGKR